MIELVCQIKKYVNTAVINITHLGISGRNKSFVLFPVKIRKHITGTRILGTLGVSRVDTLDELLSVNGLKHRDRILGQLDVTTVKNEYHQTILF